MFRARNLYPERRLVADADIFSSIAIERVAEIGQPNKLHIRQPENGLKRPGGLPNVSIYAPAAVASLQD
jgi:hypothetical protein